MSIKTKLQGAYQALSRGASQAYTGARTRLTPIYNSTYKGAIRTGTTIRRATKATYRIGREIARGIGGGALFLGSCALEAYRETRAQAAQEAEARKAYQGYQKRMTGAEANLQKRLDELGSMAIIPHETDQIVVKNMGPITVIQRPVAPGLIEGYVIDRMNNQLLRIKLQRQAQPAPARPARRTRRTAGAGATP